jgi:hypothetical protein
MRERREGGVAQQYSVHTPGDQDDHHDGGQLHDAHGLLAGFGDSLDVVPPEIDSAEYGERGCAEVWRNVKAEMDVIGGFIH